MSILNIITMVLRSVAEWKIGPFHFISPYLLLPFLLIFAKIVAPVLDKKQLHCYYCCIHICILSFTNM